MDSLNAQNIEVWDVGFLWKEFGEQIKQNKQEKFDVLINKITNSVKSSDNFLDFIDKLRSCPQGKNNWGEYQKLVGEIIEFLFCPPLTNKRIQSNDADKKNRRDFIFTNCAMDKSIWEFLRVRYLADYVVVDAKNSANKIIKQDVLQMAHYLKEMGTGLFGLIVSRNGVSNSAFQAMKDVWVFERKMIVVLDDSDVEQMLIEKRNGNDPAGIIMQKVDDFRLLI